jgi:hypothetical protein
MDIRIRWDNILTSFRLLTSIIAQYWQILTVIITIHLYCLTACVFHDLNEIIIICIDVFVIKMFVLMSSFLFVAKMHI